MNKLNQRYDLFEPPAGHRERFIQKLNVRIRREPLWRRISLTPEIAAAVLLIITGILFLNKPWSSQWVKNQIYPEVKEKQEEITAYLTNTLLDWDKFETPESQKLIEESAVQFKRLDTDYRNLQLQFQRTGNRFVLDAMIENSRQRTELLRELRDKLIQIEKRKRYENQKHSS